MDGFAAINPLRSPSWRCERVMELLRKRLMPRRVDDYPIRAYRWFILTCNAAGDEERALEALYAQIPHVAEVHFLHYSPSSHTQQILEARLLTTESFEAIGSRMGLQSPAVELFAQLFFDVRDRLQASDVINKIILGPSRSRAFFKDGTMTTEQRGLLYRLFAYYGGPLALDAMISGVANVQMPQLPSDVPSWFDNALREIVQTRAAAAAQLFEINRQNVMQVLKLALAMRSKTSAE